MHTTIPSELNTAEYSWHYNSSCTSWNGATCTGYSWNISNAQLLGIYSLNTAPGIAFFYSEASNYGSNSPAVIIAVKMNSGLTTPTGYTVIPTVHVDRPFLLFDGEYLVTINMPKNYQHSDEESESDMIDQLQLTSWKMNATNGIFTADAFYSWRSIFGSDTHPNRDIQLDLLSASGKWYLFDRTSLSLYKLSLGEGGW
jgi:hypothetical protein